MKKTTIFLLTVIMFGCSANRDLSKKSTTPVDFQKNFKSIHIVFAQRTGQRFKDYVSFPSNSSILWNKRISGILFPLSFDLTKDLFINQRINNFEIDTRFIIDTTIRAGEAYFRNRRPRTSQWITSEWIHKTALDIQANKPYQLDSVLIRTGQAKNLKNLIFYVFHDLRNPSAGGIPSGNYSSYGEMEVRLRSYVFGILNKQVVYYKDHFYKAGDIRKLDSVQVAKITYSLFEDFFKAVKK